MCLAKYEAQVFAAGINLELQTDFRHMAKANFHLEKALLTPKLNSDVYDINPLNGCWVKGVHGRGEVVHTQAVRMDGLNGTSLAVCLKSLKAFCGNSAESAHPQENCEVNAPAAYGMTGRVGYHGEFWIK